MGSHSWGSEELCPPSLECVLIPCSPLHKVDQALSFGAFPCTCSCWVAEHTRVALAGSQGLSHPELNEAGGPRAL